jgi:Ca2+-binding RTX toxin-like protein
VDLAGGAGFDTFDGIENAIGSWGHDEFFGNAADNLLMGDRGADRLVGREGNDTLVGGRDDDTMSGGTGSDTFVYTFVGEPNPHGEVITDLQRDDFIDLSGIDADKVTEGDQAFHLVEEFGNGRGELILRWEADEGITYLEGQYGPGGADFTIALLGKHDHFPGIIF